MVNILKLICTVISAHELAGLCMLLLLITYIMTTLCCGLVKDSLCHT